MNNRLIGLIICFGMSGGAVSNGLEEEDLKEFDRAWFSEINYPVVSQGSRWIEHSHRANNEELRVRYKKMKAMDAIDFSDAYIFLK